VSQFQTDEKIRLFLTTNAGSTGLNLQAANTVINVDLPWNPAVLEQRIARAHRMGQQQPVSVFVLVTEQTLEENLLTTLSSKRDLAMAALDPESRIAEVDVRTQSEDLKAKLEVLLGAKPDAPVDETVKETASLAAANDRLAVAGSTLLSAAFDLVGEIVGGHEGLKVEALRDELRTTLDAKIVADESGHRRLSVALPSRDTLAAIMNGLAGLLVGGRNRDYQETGSAHVLRDTAVAIAPN
jgi:superfamily II DNA/RNA helicase